MTKYEMQIKDIILRHLPNQKHDIFLFGSRARQKHGIWSDYDVGILGDSPVSDKIIGNIEEELENSDVLYKVDIVDFYKVTSKFSDVARDDIKLWISKKK